MVAEINDPAPWDFIRQIFWQFPAPISPATGQALWPRGIRFHGSQAWAIKSKARIIQVRGGVRAGKSFWTACKFYADIMWRWRGGHYAELYWIVGPTYKQAEAEMLHLSRLFTLMGIPHDLKQPIDQSWRITFPHRGTIIETRTGAESARIAGMACRMVALVEAHQMSDGVYRAAQERVLELRGGVIANGTFEDSDYDWFRRAASEWPAMGDAAPGETYPLPTWDNRVVFPLGRDEPIIQEYEANWTPAEFMERLGGEPAPSSAIVFPQAKQAYHVQHRFPTLGSSFDPEKPVLLWSDPGAAHAYAVIVVQIWQNIVWVIDAIYRWGRTVTEIIAECASREWAPNVELHVMDFAARQRRAEGPPIVEQWAKGWFEKTGRSMPIVAEQVALHAGYERHKKALLNGWPEQEAQAAFNPDGLIKGPVTNPMGPRLMFAPNAAIALFGGNIDGRKYSGEYNLHKNRKNSAGNITSDDPIDLDNDAIKAINYGLWNWFGAADMKQDLYRYWGRGAPEIEWSVTLG